MGEKIEMYGEKMMEMKEAFEAAMMTAEEGFKEEFLEECMEAFGEDEEACHEHWEMVKKKEEKKYCEGMGMKKDSGKGKGKDGGKGKNDGKDGGKGKGKGDGKDGGKGDKDS